MPTLDNLFEENSFIVMLNYVLLSLSKDDSGEAGRRNLRHRS